MLIIVVIGTDWIVGGTGIIPNPIFLVTALVGPTYFDTVQEYASNFHASSGNMEPVIMKGEEIEIDRNVPFTETKIGDIIVFESSPDDRRLLASRIVEVMEEDPYTVRTQGDANPASLPGREYSITEDQYVGKVIMVYPDYPSFIAGIDGRNPYG